MAVNMEMKRFYEKKHYEKRRAENALNGTCTYNGCRELGATVIKPDGSIRKIKLCARHQVYVNKRQSKNYRVRMERKRALKVA